MTCREFVDFLREYFSRTLSAKEHREFELHIEDCPDCFAYLRSYEETIKLGKAAFADLDEAIPQDVPERLVQAILASTAPNDSQ